MPEKGIALFEAVLESESLWPPCGSGSFLRRSGGGTQGREKREDTILVEAEFEDEPAN
jgi:hypothetical protein